MRTPLLLLLALSTTLSLAAPVVSAAESAGRKEALKTAFATREADLVKAKAAGLLGETTAGLLAVPAGAAADPAAAELMAKENADRKELYALLSAETTATPQQVAERNAMRIYQQAPAGTWLQKRDGTWAKK
jgi:uncharacterized protein YdbL (DUF1318 family)